VADYNSFVLDLLCYRWLSLCNHDPLCIGSLLDFCGLFAFVFLGGGGLCLLVFSFALYSWWMGSHPWFLFTWFFFFVSSLGYVPWDPEFSQLPHLLMGNWGTSFGSPQYRPYTFPPFIPPFIPFLQMPLVCCHYHPSSTFDLPPFICILMLSKTLYRN